MWCPGSGVVLDHINGVILPDATSNDKPDLGIMFKIAVAGAHRKMMFKSHFMFNIRYQQSINENRDVHLDLYAILKYITGLVCHTKYAQRLTNVIS